MAAFDLCLETTHATLHREDGFSEERRSQCGEGVQSLARARCRWGREVCSLRITCRPEEPMSSAGSRVGPSRVTHRIAARPSSATSGRVPRGAESRLCRGLQDSVHGRLDVPWLAAG